MKIPEALEWEEQLKLFEQRGMDVQDAAQNQTKLEHISYYNILKFIRKHVSPKR